jgi:DNA-binding Lrp family transcriptional regulator
MKQKVLDSASWKILAAVQRNSRVSIAELAEIAGLSATPCWRRQKELEESGLIRGYPALLDRHQLGLEVCVFASVTLTRHEEGIVERFEQALKLRTEVLECYELTGNADYLVKVLVPDMKTYHEFLHNVLLRLPGVATFNTSVALREVKYEVALPIESAHA